MFLIRSMGYGGAERQLVLLSKGLQRVGHTVVVTVFYAGGPLERELAEAGIRVLTLGKAGRWDVLGCLRRLVGWVRTERPDVLHGYLAEPNLFALAVKPFCPSVGIVWGARGSVLDFSRYEWVDRLSFALNCQLSRFADAVIVNSQMGLRFHLEHGYPAGKTVCVPNGIDTERFRPQREKGWGLRAAWGVQEGEQLVGLVGRLDPMKDHPVFLDAAALVARQRCNVRFVCVGDGPQAFAEELRARASSLGIQDRVRWVPATQDMPAVYNALDLLVSSSYGEGMPNVIAEAMACGVPCVVTDVGDSAWVVGDCGEVVPPKAPQELAAAVARVLGRGAWSVEQIRSRITERLSAGSLVARTEQVLGSVALRAQVEGAARPLTTGV